MSVTTSPTRIASKEVLATLTYTGQTQDTVRLTRGQIINGLNMFVEANYGVTTDTANRNPVGVFNAIKQLEIANNNGKIIHRLSGQDIVEYFSKKNGVGGVEAQLHAGAANASNQTAHHHIKFPFFFDDGKGEDDACLQTFTQDVVLKIEWNVPTAAGTFYGTPTGLTVASLSLKLETENWRVQGAELQRFLSGVERSIVTMDVAITQSNDALQVKNLPANEMYRKHTLFPRSTVNNMTQGNEAIIVQTKEMAVKRTFENTVVQRGLVRGYRSDTIQARENPSLPAGMIDINYLRFGSLRDFAPSTQANELFFELPVVNTGTEPHIRVVSDIFRKQQ